MTMHDYNKSVKASIGGTRYSKSSPETKCDYVEDGECVVAKQLGKPAFPCTGSRPEGCGVWMKTKRGEDLS